MVLGPRVVLAAAAVLTLGASCGGGAETVTASPEERADRLGCTAVEEIDYFNAPIRGRAATGGVRCAVGTARLHIFDRAPLG